MSEFDKDKVDAMQRSIIRVLGSSHLDSEQLADIMGEIVMKRDVSDLFREAIAGLISNHTLEFDRDWKVFRP